jgi:hypothetical protein
MQVGYKADSPPSALGAELRISGAVTTLSVCFVACVWTALPLFHPDAMTDHIIIEV